MAKHMENKLKQYISSLKTHLNILLLEEYISGLEFYFMPDGSLKMLGSIPCLALTDYTPVFVDRIIVNKV